MAFNKEHASWVINVAGRAGVLTLTHWNLSFKLLMIISQNCLVVVARKELLYN